MSINLDDFARMASEMPGFKELEKFWREAEKDMSPEELKRLSDMFDQDFEEAVAQAQGLGLDMEQYAHMMQQLFK